MRKILTALVALVSLLSIVPLVAPVGDTTTNIGTLTASVSVGNLCDVAASPINSFGTLIPGDTSATETTSVSQVNGNINAPLTIYGQDWNFGSSPTMPVGATEWKSGGSFTPLAVGLTGASVGTLSYNNPTSVDLEVVVPAHQLAASYAQTITFSVSC